MAKTRTNASSRGDGELAGNMMGGEQRREAAENKIILNSIFLGIVSARPESGEQAPKDTTLLSLSLPPLSFSTWPELIVRDRFVTYLQHSADSWTLIYPVCSLWSRVPSPSPRIQVQVPLDHPRCIHVVLHFLPCKVRKLDEING